MRAASAMKLEAKAWEFVRAVMTDPEELTRDLDRMIELKRKGQRGDPREETARWLDEFAKLERLRDGYHDQAAEGLMDLDKLREKLAGLDERRRVIEKELEALEGRKEELERLESDREAIIEHYATASSPSQATPKTRSSSGRRWRWWRRRRVNERWSGCATGHSGACRKVASRIWP